MVVVEEADKGKDEGYGNEVGDVDEAESLHVKWKGLDV
jgi:hypothetical protein